MTRPQRKKAAPQTSVDFGWWEVFAPSLHGRAHLWNQAQWAEQIEWMGSRGARVLFLYLHWYSTGYHSSLAWLDQPDFSLNVATENAVLRRLLRQARGRKIRVYLVNQVYLYDAETYDGPTVLDEFADAAHYWPKRLVVADAAETSVRNRIAKMFVEQAELFPNAAGFLLEGEGKTSKGNYLAKRALTEREAKLAAKVERAVRRTGYAGEVGYIYRGRELDPNLFVETTKRKVRLVVFNPDPDDRAGEKGLREAVETGQPVTYVADGFIGARRYEARYTGRFHPEVGWKRFAEQAVRHRPEQLVFFGYDWCDVGGEPAVLREKLATVARRVLRSG
ncbi:MAG: hypothetical protein GXO73_08820 [Calditrichaeota bacterium]|nr:hypothetical protein [Calditrichota bacterium]